MAEWLLITELYLGAADIGKLSRSLQEPDRELTK